MAEELEESEVIFRESVEDEDGSYNEDRGSISISNSRSKNAKRQKTKADSVLPVSIPENVSRNSWLRYVEAEVDGDDGEMVPPHVIARRRLDGKMMAYSVCSGNGRTLKGRDLSEVRNSILRMTGFLET
ncbi:hypothetical protein BUALT_Bualt18G0120400 [Buddleja alternifolia]|uniref:Senescence regulator n=1 Tax=Buddleja alternifolia TaxID=168488 RepID=A0AAV6WE04_9LAMI|nr:hypothetical protein BUALT_Bualt18G0120400 [Buddleja alternifolia]